MNFECWASGTWAAGSWVVGSWCPGATPADAGGGMYAHRLPPYRLDEEEEFLIIALMETLLNE